MSASELVRELNDLGVRLWEEDGKIRFQAPKGVLTKDRRAALARQKEAVLAHLRASTATIAARPEHRHDPFPLTDVQSAYLLGRGGGFLYGGVGCHAYAELELDRLDPERLAQAWNRLVRRHDMLRAVISPDGSQQVLPDVPDFSIPFSDLDEAGQDGMSALEATRAAMDHRVYDPGSWPLFDLRASRIGGKSLLHVSIDFLIADYVSIFILLDELRQIYERPDAALPELSLTFRDYQLANRSRRSGLDYERDRAYWLGRADDFPGAPDLPVIEAPASDEPARFRRWQLTLDRQTWSSLVRRARRHNLSPSGAVMAAYAEAIGRWSRHPRFALNLTVLSRPPIHPDVARMVGDFTTVNLLDVDLREASSFVGRARKMQDRLGEDLDHAMFSGIELIRELARRRGTRDALMPVVFTSTLGLSPDGGALPMGKLVRGISQTPQVWIDCQAMERDGRLSVNWDVRERVFPEGMIEAMFTSFERLVRELSSNARTWDAGCPIPLPGEQAARRAAVNRTSTAVPEGTLVSDALEWALREPRRPCVLSLDGVLTYGEIFRQAGAVAAALERGGVVPGEIVAVVAEKGPAQVVAIVGVLLAGAAYLPIEPAEPPSRRDEILADAGVRMVLTDTSRELPAAVSQIVSSSLPPAESFPEPGRVSPDMLAYVIYTSGSTGKPKGVMITHRAALNTVVDVNERFSVGPEDRVLCVSSLAFDLSVYDVFGLLSVGGGLVFPAPERRSDPSHWAELIANHRVTVWNTVPGLMAMLCAYVDAAPHVDLTTLRLVLLSGDWVPVDLVRRLRHRLPNAELVALGGATEGSIWSIYFPLRELRSDAAFVPYGRPLANQTMHVLDVLGRPCPDGVVGEICIGGAGVALGYLNDETRTRERFVAAADDGVRLYRTGDLGRFLADGDIEILGREDQQAKIRGHRVELGEVEAALSTYPAVARAVVAVQGERGESRRLLAFVEASRSDPREPVGLARIAEPVAEALTSRESAGGYLEYARLLDRAALASILDAFHAARLFEDDRSLSDELVCAALGARPRYHRLVRRWLRALVNHEVLELDEDGEFRRATRTASPLDADALWSAVDELPPFDSPELLQYFRDSGRHLSALVRGERSALDLLFPQGRSDISVGLHERSFFHRWGNRVVAEMVTAAADAASPSRPLRVLEVGAGVGGLTAAVLHAVGERCEYCFTDVTPFFLNAARERFAGMPSIRFRRFDLNHGYREQGFRANAFDVIVAGDALHVARNVPRVLAELREMLAPGGFLIAVEMTRDHLQIMTSLELLNDGDENAPTFDDARGARDETFFSRDAWLELLGDSGANEVEVLPRADDAFSEIGLCVFSARYKCDRANVRVDLLDEHLRDRLPAHMIPAEIEVLDQMPLTANGKVDRKRLAEWGGSPVSGENQTDSLETELERRLARIWGPVLGLAAVERDQDFFGAGGDSLLAAQLAGRMIEELPEAGSIFFDDLLRMVLEGPTLAQLAQSVDGARRDTAAPQDADDSNPLVALGGAAGQPPLIVVHDGAGPLAEVGTLAAHLTSRFAVFEVRMGSDDGSVSQLAARCHAAIEQAGLENVHLVGGGRGSRLAIEIGRHLIESGRDSIGMTVSSFGDEAASPEAISAYAGDVNLIRRPEDTGAEARWRSVCLGHVQVTELDSAEPADIARALAAAGE